MVVLPLLEHGHFHLFLSHQWGDGQDQMRVVKQRLIEMIPEVFAPLRSENPTRLSQPSSAFFPLFSAFFCPPRACFLPLTPGLSRFEYFSTSTTSRRDVAWSASDHDQL